MNTFLTPNLSNNWKCPVCGNADDLPVILIEMYGTEEDGKTQAKQLHMNCIKLTYVPNELIGDFLFQTIRKEQ